MFWISNNCCMIEWCEFGLPLLSYNLILVSMTCYCKWRVWQCCITTLFPQQPLCVYRLSWFTIRLTASPVDMPSSSTSTNVTCIVSKQFNRHWSFVSLFLTHLNFFLSVSGLGKCWTWDNRLKCKCTKIVR